jgi:hypothetical protein
MTTSVPPENGEVRLLSGDWAPKEPQARKIDLVFRTVGERTSDLALSLALKNIRPNRAWVIDRVKPFAAAVSRMLEIEHDCSHVVHMDADCLILEDMRPWLEQNELPYVDCYVNDRFRGPIHCGVHITRIDVIRRMKEVPIPENDMAYVLRPESRLRNLALQSLKAEKQLRHFSILHDHFQRYTDIFHKYALRELRSRTEFQRKRLDAATARWGAGVDFDVARLAMAHAARTVPEGAKPKHVEAYIHNLPHTAQTELLRAGLGHQPPLTMEEVETYMSEQRTPSTAGFFLGRKKPKVFGLGLSRTGTRSLSSALHVLGLDVAHYPTDRGSLEAMVRGDGRFPLLEQYDGLTDITTIPYLNELDRDHPGAKFILTVRDKEGWLRSCKNHWTGRSPFEKIVSTEHETHMEIRRLLRAAVYGCYDFNAERFSRVYDEHVARVMKYFEHRPDDLLVMNIVAGDRWEKLAPFVGCPVIEAPFPHKGKKLSEKMASLEVDD